MKHRCRRTPGLLLCSGVLCALLGLIGGYFDSVFAEIFRTDYVVIDAVSGTTMRYLIPAVQEHSESFEGVFVLRTPLTAVLEVKR